MNRAKRNKRKLEILKLIAENPSITPSELSEISHIEIHNARNLLRKYHKQSPLSRVGRDELGAYPMKSRAKELTAWIG